MMCVLIVLLAAPPAFSMEASCVVFLYENHILLIARMFPLYPHSVR